MLALLMWLPSPFGYAQNSVHETHRRKSIPIHSTVAETFQWMKAQLPNTAVVASDWIHGSQLNVLSDVKTITDQDHFIQHWIHLYYRYLFCGHSEKEALQFLKTHEATHLMLTEVDVVRGARVYSELGSQSEHAPSFEILEFRETIRAKEHIFLFPKREISIFKNIQMKTHPENNTLIFAIAVRHDGSVTNLPYVAFYNQTREASKNQDGSKTGGLILYFTEQQKFEKCYYVPPIAWDNFAIRLFLRSIPSDAFLPIYTTRKIEATDVKVWEIHYPPDIQPNPKYLETGPRKIKAH